jgi:mannosyltransferase
VTSGAATRRDVIAIAAVATVAFAIALASRSFWGDEAFSVVVAKASWHDFVHTLTTSQANMSLYYVVLRGWVAVVGDGEVAVRALSVVFAVATVPLLYALVARTVGRPAAVVSTVVLVLDPTFVRAAQDARSYSLVVLLVVAATYLMVSLRDDDHPSWALPVYVAVATLSLYAHFYAAFVLAVHALVAALERRSDVRRRQFTALGAVVLLASPLVAFAATQDHGQVSHLTRPSILDAVRGVRSLIGMGNVGLLVFFAGAVAVLSRFRPRTSRDARSPVVLFAAWAAVPVVAAFAVSQAKPVFAARYLIVILPALAVLLGWAVASIERRASAVVTAALIVLSIVNLPYLRPGFEYEDFRGAADYLTTAARPGDGVVFYRPSRRVAAEFYLRRTGARSPAMTPVFPAAPWGEFDLVRDYEHVTPTAREWASIETAASRRRMWLFLSKPANEGEHRKRVVRARLLSVVARVACRTSLRRFHGLEIHEFVPGTQCAG